MPSKQPVGNIKQILFWGTGSSLVIIFLTLFIFKQASDRVLTTLNNLIRPPAPELQVADSTSLLKQIQNLQELTTTVYHTETIVPTSADLVFGNNWTIATTKLLYLARGEVKAGIDLAEITPEDITVKDNRIILNLPAAKILDSKIDLNNSQVYHYDRGFLNLGPDVAPELQSLAQRKTLARMTHNACQEGILTTASEQAETAISEFLTLTNARSIEVKVSNELNDSCLAMIQN